MLASCGFSARGATSRWLAHRDGDSRVVGSYSKRKVAAFPLHAKRVLAKAKAGNERERFPDRSGQNALEGNVDGR